MSEPKLCVILLNYANWRDTLECLESLARATYDNLSVVVVDSGSPNDSVARLTEWVRTGDDARAASTAWSQLPAATRQRPTAAEVRALEEPGATGRCLPRFSRRMTMLTARSRLGFAEGCNAGLRLCLEDPTARYVWLLNNDAIAAPEAASLLVRRALEIGPSLGALGTLIADYRRPDRIQILGGGRVNRLAAEIRFPAHGKPVAQAGSQATELGELDYISGASLLTSLTAVRRVGLLDEAMHLYWEDTDWCARMRRAGLHLAVCPEAVIWHKGHASTRGINRYTKYHTFRSAAVYMRRHRRRWLPPLLVRLGKSLVRDLLTARPLDAAAAVRGLSAGMRIAGADPLVKPRDRPSRTPPSDA